MVNDYTLSVRLLDELHAQVEKIAYSDAIGKAIEDVKNAKTIEGDEFFTKLDNLRNRHKKF